MNRAIFRKLVIAHHWLDRCWNTEQHDRICDMADGGFTIHELAVAVWICTGGWELGEIERRMIDYIQR